MFNTILKRYYSLISDKKFSEILVGSSWALLARMVAAGMALAINIVVAQFYGAEVIGILAILTSFLMLATMFTLCGTGMSILRLIPEHIIKYSPTSAFRVYRKAQYIVICISFVTGIIYFFFSDFIAENIFSKQHLSFYFKISSVFIVFNSIMILNTQAARGLKLMKYFALMQFLPQTSNLILLILMGLFLLDKDVPIYAFLLSSVITGIIGWIMMKLAFKRRMQSEDIVKNMSTRVILSTSLPMFMTITMNFILGQIGVIILGMFRSDAEVGYFSIAVKLATLTSFILAAINSIAAPKFSELFHSGKMDELFYIAKKSAKLIFWSTSPLLFLLVVLGKPILGLLFGNEFSIAYIALLFIAVGQFVNSISGSTDFFMNMTGHQIILRNIMLAAAILNVTLNFILIPSLGMNGAAIASMVSMSFWNITTLLFIRYKFGRSIGYFPFITA